MGKPRLSTDEAFGRIKAKHPDIEILSREYVSYHSSLNLKCKVCSYEWKATCANVIGQNTGCPKCSKRLKLSTDEAFKRIKERHPNIQILSKNYQNAHSLLIFQCSVCSYKWKASYASLMFGGACARCGVFASADKKRLSTDKAFKRIREANPDIQILSEKYISNSSLLNLKCKICERKWNASYSSLVYCKSRCPRCARKSTKGELIVKGWLESWGFKLAN